MRYMVTANDPFGAPRAWGIASNPTDARKEAERQLAAYVADPVREFPDPAAYTFHVHETD